MKKYWLKREKWYTTCTFTTSHAFPLDPSRITRATLKRWQSDSIPFPLLYFFILHYMENIHPAFHKYFIFWLKDIQKTADKVRSYNPRHIQYSDLLDDFISVLDYWIDIWTIISATKRDFYFSHCIQQSNIDTPKALAKSCHTFVNSITFEYHIQQFERLDLTRSQATQAAKRFYIENYEAINQKMSELLEETLLQTPLSSSYFI